MVLQKRNSINKMNMQKQKLVKTFLAWSLVVPIPLGFSRSVDPILTHMCSTENGAKFWREFLDCRIFLDAQDIQILQIQAVLNNCIPVSSPEEVEETRCFVCLNPDRWVKMMECMNARLIELQDESNPYLELSPGTVYRVCVSVLVSEADRFLYRKVPFLPEDDRNFTSNCSTMVL